MSIKKIELGGPFLCNDEKFAISKVIDSSLIATGDTAREFEEQLAKKFKRAHCVVVNSGTSALYLGLKILGLKKIIIPAITCTAVLHAVLNAGLKPIITDVDCDTHNVDLSTLSEEQLNEADALLITHTYGHSANMDVITSYVEKYNLLLIEDFAQATGGYYKAKILGSFGDVSITSFYGPKNMTTGHGGAIFVDQKELYDKLVYGCGYSSTNYYNDIIPMNLRMTDIQAAMGLVQLEKLNKMIDMRRQVAKIYKKELSALPMKLPQEKDYAKHAYYKYPIILPNWVEKEMFIRNMDELGVKVGVLYDPPLHKTKIALKMLNINVNLPISEYLASRTVSIPMFIGLKEEDIIRIAKAVKNSIGD